VAKIQNVAMVTKVQKMIIHSVQRILLKLDTKIDHQSKFCSLFLKFQNGHQYENTKINGNGYLQGARHAAHMVTILVYYGGQNTKILRFGQNLVSK
jgi:hypothetical protein